MDNKEVEEPNDTTKGSETKEQTDYSSIEKASDEKLEELYQKTNKRKVPYYQTAKEALIKWYNMTEEQAEEYIANNDIDAIENGTPEVYGVGAKDSINSGLKSIAKSLDLTDDEYKILEDEVYNGVREENSVLSSLNSRIEEKGLDSNEVIMDAFFDIHDGWVKKYQSNFDKTGDDGKYRDKNYQHLPTELIGPNEVGSDAIFLNSILKAANISMNKEGLEKTYKARQENFLKEKEIYTKDDLKRYMSTEWKSYLEKAGYSEDKLKLLDDEKFLDEKVIPKFEKDDTRRIQEVWIQVINEAEEKIAQIEAKKDRTAEDYEQRRQLKQKVKDLHAHGILGRTYKNLGDPVVKFTGNEVENFVHSKYSDEIKAAEDDPNKEVEQLEGGIFVVTDIKENAETLKKEESKRLPLEEELSLLKEKFVELSERKKDEKTKVNPKNPGE